MVMFCLPALRKLSKKVGGTAEHVEALTISAAQMSSHDFH
jgi:hypothetical protein